MSDSVKKWYEMKEEGWWTRDPEKANIVHSHAYVWVLDYEDAKYIVITSGILTLCQSKNSL